ncbi:hypothetical protein [Halalkalibacillus halophilus]|uniref:hypothetical protein n=1 Tax=Halalkalibacillus halophilus TaxID=392827 RepID=UPI000482D68C|nr:hypothetical protein [Halalkalibacillus halophilus]
MGWKNILSIQDTLFNGIYANPLHINKTEKDLTIYSYQPILEFRDVNSNQSRYWRLECMEDKEGDDFLNPVEQETPYPLPYESATGPYQDHIIEASSFLVQNNRIKHVTGFGIKKDHLEYLSVIVLKLEELYIIINPGGVIEITVTNNEPEINDEILFSTLK